MKKSLAAAMMIMYNFSEVDLEALDYNSIPLQRFEDLSHFLTVAPLSRTEVTIDRVDRPLYAPRQTPSVDLPFSERRDVCHCFTPPVCGSGRPAWIT